MQFRTTARLQEIDVLTRKIVMDVIIETSKKASEDIQRYAIKLS